MKKSIKKVLSTVTALCMVASVSGQFVQKFDTNGASAMTVEYLNRGISAINTGSGMMISWRSLANDSADTVFKLYRNDNLVYTSNPGNATCYLDKDGKSSDSYKVETISGGTVISTDNCSMISNNSYFDIKMDIPKGGSGYSYSPNDCSVGDVDGDGQYEIFVKWDPSNSQDNSRSGVTGNVYIDCYRLDSTKLWRIDLGKNIRAGAHYTQFLVADFDLDGKAEMTCKTADGTVDGQGNVIGDSSKDYRNSSGYVLDGPEYYTLFDGATGKALDSVDYEPARGTVSKWGDKYGNRVDRFLGAVCYLDGVKPSAVTVRGYYTRMTACAYDVVNDKLVKRWYFDTGNDSSATGYGDGNHNCMPADVDGDGKQELILGATCLDDDGSVLWCTNKGHGDAMHLGDLLPDRAGLELWVCHEESPYGQSLIDASNGKIIFHQDASKDTGRGAGDNIWAGNDGAEFWSSATDGLLNGSGTKVAEKTNVAVNFFSFWDGDLERELLDGYAISKYNGNGVDRLLTATGCTSNNSTKSTPNLSADIFGDWREELILRTEDNSALRIYCTPYSTDYRITTLMHDPHYRNQVAGQNIAYNQPPHTSFYLGSDQKLPTMPTVTVLGKGTVTPAEPVDPTPVAVQLVEGATYMIKNANSGLYLEVANGSAENSANVQQWGADVSANHNTWRAVSAGDGYYYLVSQLGDKATYVLDIAGKKTANGTNIAIYQYKGSDNQQFKFTQNADGTYIIRTKITGDDSCIEVANADTSSGANVQQYETNGHACQNWILEQVENSGCVMDTSVNYMFSNVNSNLYMEVANGSAEDNANVQQWGANGSADHNTWSLKDAGNGYYYVLSQLADGSTFYLDVADGKSASGTNVQILKENKTSSQLFKFVKNLDGTYNILTKASKDKCAVEVINADTANGANIQQWEVNGHACQKWNAETIAIETTTTTVTEPIVTTTTVTTPVTTQKPSVSSTSTEESIVTTTVTTPVTTQVPTQEPPVSSTTSEDDTILLGDANCDGKVAVADAVAVSAYVSNAKNNSLDEKGIANSDVHSKGNGLNASDALMIQQYATGIISSL